MGKLLLGEANTMMCKHEYLVGIPSQWLPLGTLGQGDALERRRGGWGLEGSGSEGGGVGPPP